eukprot:m.324616 g.324616  ORF g.324616 m.324616 type:complete len:184 (-) comp16465_c0_seq6:536-1087(-)
MSRLCDCVNCCTNRNSALVAIYRRDNGGLSRARASAEFVRTRRPLDPDERRKAMGEVQMATLNVGLGIGALVGLIVACALWVQHGKLDKNDETKFSLVVLIASFFGLHLGLFIACLFQSSRKAAYWCRWPGCYEPPPEIVNFSGIAVGNPDADSDADYHSISSGDLDTDANGAITVDEWGLRS